MVCDNLSRCINQRMKATICFMQATWQLQLKAVAITFKCWKQTCTFVGLDPIQNQIKTSLQTCQYYNLRRNPRRLSAEFSQVKTKTITCVSLCHIKAEHINDFTPLPPIALLNNSSIFSLAKFLPFKRPPLTGLPMEEHHFNIVLGVRGLRPRLDFMCC